MNLSNCPLDSTVTVLYVEGTPAQQLRYAEMGLLPGSTAAAILSGFGRRRVIKLGAERIAFAPEAASKVHVQLAGSARR
ncbi:FeoA family protein [Timonella senegalensis]|uniref:FeoA family protein n=1 Tax=Timonella senegalensis TaxID=1465825 RepID=UPI0009DB61E9|nr:FeoA family protein [Timonella senegalensis]